MTTWYQARRVDGKIVSFEATKETDKTLTFYSNFEKREVTIHKAKEGMFCFKQWAQAHEWLRSITWLELLEARTKLNAAVMYKRPEPDIAACRHRLKWAQSIHGNVKGMKAPT